MKRFAFTLTELLIALSIVGVIATLTVPNVTKNIFTKMNVAKLENTVDTMNTAIKSMMLRERVMKVEDATINTNPSSFFYNYIKVSKICEDSIYGDCFSSSYKSINGDAATLMSASNLLGAVILANGAAVALYPFQGSAHGFYIDVNGISPPNVIGRDFFNVTFDSEGIVGADGDEEDLTDASRCLSGLGLGRACVYRLIMNGWELDY